MLTRHGCFRKLRTDNGLENRGIVAEFTKRYNIKHVFSSAYYPEGNGMVERGHPDIYRTLSKMGNGKSDDWVDNLSAALWADRTTVRRSTGLTAAYLIYGSDPVLPIELSYATWRTVNWSGIHITDELVAARAQQIR